MAINNVSWTDPAQVTITKLQQMVQDENNTTDNIHTQYLKEYLDLMKYTISHINSFVISDSFIFVAGSMIPTEGIGDNASALSTSYFSISAQDDYTRGLSCLFFVPDIITNIDIDVLAKATYTGSGSGNTAEIRYSISELDTDGTLTEKISGSYSSITKDDTWRAYSMGSTIDISSVDSSKICVIQIIGHTTVATGSANGTLLLTRQLKVTPHATNEN